jgi:hypothetical protein
MFTGIIAERGTITDVHPSGDSVRVTVRAPQAVSKADHGDSIAISGVCLTVIEQTDDSFVADVMGQTIAMSNPDQWQVGRTVNVESAMSAGEQLGGQTALAGARRCAARRGLVHVHDAAGSHLLARASFEFTPASASELYISVLQSTILPPSSAGAQQQQQHAAPWRQPHFRQPPAWLLLPPATDASRTP